MAIFFCLNQANPTSHLKLKSVLPKKLFNCVSPQLTITCSNSVMETLEKGVKHAQS